MSTIAIIPARGGSKRIPKKNIKNFLGKPIIAYSIEIALQSQLFSAVLVSTDSEEIALIAQKYGATVPFLRPKELADDFTGTSPVVAQAIVEYEKKFSTKVNFACCIYATVPFLKEEYLQVAAKAVKKEGVDFAFAATNYPYPIQRSFYKTAEGNCQMLFPEQEEVRSQDLQEVYHDAGQFYFGQKDAFLENRSIFSSSSIPIILPCYLVQDIDVPDDWKRAELMFKALNS